MRVAYLGLALAALVTPVVAGAAPAHEETARIQRELTDPIWADRLTDAMLAMSRALMNMPVGEVEAAVEGRQPTAADKRRTVQSETGLSEQQLRGQIEDSRASMRAGMEAVAAALPAIMKGVSDARRELEKASANVPRPDYPKR
jgi:phage-related tail protein